MAVNAGSRIGSYEVVAAIGAGGMGEVYRARDTRLKRDVAIKILPEAFASDPDRLARFQREAEVLASLNHPNIAAIHGFEESDATRALVMELVEGGTLADRIARGPVPIDEALPIAKQIAEALEAAHERGIIHRDLKPANIKVRPDGAVKVLDFGLAKLSASTTGPVTNPTAMSMSPTITSPPLVSGVGVLLGTAAYMSPEQAKGRPADKRSDIWAFGCVLYETLSAKRAFAGDDVSDTLVAILRDDPDWSALPSRTPIRIRQAIRMCLQRNPKQRAADIRDVRLVLDGAFDADVDEADRSQSLVGADAAFVKSRTRRFMLGATAGLTIGSFLAAAAVWWVMRPAAPALVRTEITTSSATALNVAGPASDIAVTSDGSRIVYRGLGKLNVRSLDQLQPASLSISGNPYDIFVSPDGQWVGFFDGALLKKVAITGGPPVTICDPGGTGRGAVWGDDGTIIFATASEATGLQRVSATGGTPTVLTKPDHKNGEGDHIFPQLLPGSGAILFTVTRTGTAENASVAVRDLRTGVQKTLIRGASNARYVPSGHLVYDVDGSLRTVAFNLQKLEVTGTAVPVVPQVLTKIGGAADFAVAANGTFIYVPAGTVAPSATRTLVWIDRQGHEEPLRTPERAYVYPRVSPDGTRVALAITDQQNDIWVLQLTRNTLTRFTFDPGADSYPVWTHDSRRLIFGSSRAGQPNLFWQAADGSGTAERLTNTAINQQAFTISPDDARLVFREGGTPYDLHVLLLSSNDRRSERMFQTPFSETNADISPDGRWIAYESDESGQREVYVRPFPNVDAGRWQVSSGGGSRPVWAKSTRELFYLATAGEEASLMSVHVEAGAAWSASIPTKLFSGRFFYEDVEGQQGQGRTYDVAPDGRRFLMIKESNAAAATSSIVVVQNWTEELKRLVPTK